MTTLTTTLRSPVTSLQNLMVTIYNSKPLQSVLFKFNIDSALTNYPKHPNSPFMEKNVTKCGDTNYYFGNLELSIGKLKK